jgi:hypothetical protein
LGHPDKYFFHSPIKLNSFFCTCAECVFNFLACLVQENKKYKVSVYFSENANYFQRLFRKPHQISVPAFFHGWLLEQFRRLSEQLLGSLEALTSFQKRITGRILTIKVVSAFIEES